MARLPKNDKVVDIGTIAAALGVSKTTVSWQYPAMAVWAQQPVSAYRIT